MGWNFLQNMLWIQTVFLWEEGYACGYFELHLWQIPLTLLPSSEVAVFSWNSLCWRSTTELCDYVTHSQSAWTLVFLISTFLMRKGASKALIFSRCQYSSPMLSFVFSKGCSLEPCTQTSSVTQCIFCNKAFALKIHFYDKQFKKLSELSTVDVISLLYDLYCQFN